MGTINLFEFDNFENNIGNGNYIKSPLNYTGGKYKIVTANHSFVS